MAETRGPKRKQATREEFAPLMEITHQDVTKLVLETRAYARRSDRPVARRLRAPHEKSAGRLVAKTINLLGVVAARIDTDGRWEKQEVFGQQRLDGGRRHGKRCDLFQSKSRNTGAGLLSFPDAYQREYFEQLTSEEVRTRFVRGHPVR